MSAVLVPSHTEPQRQSAQSAGSPTPRRRHVTAGTVLSYVAVAVLAVIWLVPLFWAVNTAFKSETDASASPVHVLPAHGYTIDAFRLIFQSGRVQVWLGNSVIVAVAVTAITLVVSTLCAYAFARLDFPFRRVLYTITVGSILVPTQIFIVPLYDELRSLHMIDTYWAIILPQTIAPVMVFVLKRFFDEIPRELEEAALVDGASRLRIFGQIVLPLSRPIIAAVSIFVFIGAWNNFLLPFIVTNNPNLMTLPVGLQTVTPGYGVTYALQMAEAVFAALPLIVVFVLFQRQIIRGIATTGIAGQ